MQSVTDCKREESVKQVLGVQNQSHQVASQHRNPYFVFTTYPGIRNTWILKEHISKAYFHGVDFQKSPARRPQDYG